MEVAITMPGGGVEHINPALVYVARDLTAFEKEENPTFVTCLWGGGFKIYPAETLKSLNDKLCPPVKFARLTAPSGQLLLVNMEAVDDWNPPLKDDDERTRSVLPFGPGAQAARVRVRENRNDLIAIWEKAGVPTDVFS